MGDIVRKLMLDEIETFLPSQENYSIKLPKRKDSYTPYLSDLLNDLNDSDLKEIEVFKPVSQGITESFKPNIGFEEFCNELYSNISKGYQIPLEILQRPLIYRIDFEQLIEYNGFLTEV